LVAKTLVLKKLWNFTELLLNPAAHDKAL